MAFGPDDVQELQPEGLEELADLRKTWPVVWLNVDGLGDAEVLHEVGAAFELHPLALEDVVSVHQRPKLEAYGRQQFLVLRMVTTGEGPLTEQLSLFLGPGYVLTFQERAGDCLDPVRDRVRKGRGRVRSAGADYLAYALVDAIVDNYFPVIERLSDVLYDLEARIVAGQRGDTMQRVYRLKRELLGLRRAIFPLREVLGYLARGDVEQVGPETRIYFRDCYDHSFQVLELIESSRETASGLMDLYLNTLSQRMNESMMVLTIIATIFIPLSFVAGLYGMNFDRGASPWNMPELGWRYGYPFALAAMACIAGGMLVYFYRRGWIGNRDAPSSSEA